MIKKSTGTILRQVRSLMKNVSFVVEPIQAYIVPSCDQHNNEYLRQSDKRRDFVTGFTGSAGTAIITEQHACLWTDGRYYLQAAQQLDENWTLMKEGLTATPTQQEWLCSNLSAGSRVGVDPWLLTYTLWKDLAEKLRLNGHKLVPITTNLIDLVWADRPVAQNNKIIPLQLKYTGIVNEKGKASCQKIADVREKMAEKKASLLVLTALDEIAWLFNLRGSDINFNPVFFSFAAITSSDINLFVDESKLSDATTEHFKKEDINVCVRPYDKVSEFVQGFVSEGQGKVWLSKSAGYYLHSLVPDERRVSDITPINVMKAIKNDVESQGLVNCHIRDGAALCCYFAWLEETLAKGGEVDEVSGAEKLETFRELQEDYMGASFETISSAGPNGAIIHYSPSAETARKITTSELYLCDSGGQYKDGTTDVTRTLHFGQPTNYEKECFTRVLKGQIAIARSVFPTRIKGNCLDSFARKCLWDVGLDYQHGTSHGIGHFLNVHEGPMGISYREYPDDPGLQKGMFLSNEPGYYEDGKFGIRLENIVRIVPANTPHNFKERGFLTFDTVTLVPIQTKLIDTELLTVDEINYINDYHQLCLEKVGDLLKKIDEKQGMRWLQKETTPIH